MSPRRTVATPMPKRKRGRTSDKSDRPSQLRIKGLVLIMGTSFAATTLGVLQVQAQFQVRDYEMEARRLQELATERRDEVKTLQTNLGGLKRSEMLRQAAIGPLGMVEPTPEVIGELDVSPSLINEIERAEEKARRKLAAEHERLEFFRKEEW